MVNLDQLANCPPQDFVAQQVQELEADLLQNEEAITVANPGTPLPVCNFCMSNVATRVAVPCGHWAGCIDCSKRNVRTPVYFMAVGDLEITEVRLPIRCGQCSSLIGKLIRVFE